ncbi:hypothetical protein L484_013009 [Morus notabilis]|uniref:Retrotransposon gag domain-containing protein n=1 Tax=Morus notabilis TaxID=981085 RepID=W9S3G0_9ROSA|nr:hypothetical protein L484_013009 [Morus notabilis]
MAKHGEESSKKITVDSGEVEALWNTMRDLEQRIEMKFDKTSDESESEEELLCRRRHYRVASETEDEDDLDLRYDCHPTTRSKGFKLKIDIPEFDGYLDIEKFLDWLKTVDNFMDYMDIPKREQVKLIAYRLNDGASAW